MDNKLVKDWLLVLAQVSLATLAAYQVSGDVLAGAVAGLGTLVGILQEKPGFAKKA